MEKKSIGTFIAALRKASGLTQKQLAEKLNVSDKAVSRWERDESAPDLTLVPVLAEIFDVTTDELLRGERSAAHVNSERAAARTEKQLRHLLKDTLTKHKIRSCISVAVALVGLIAAMIGNSGFLRAYIGFMVGCIFFIAAAACQAIFLTLGLSAIDNEELDPNRVAPTRKALILVSELVLGVILVLFGACLPLVVFVPDTYMGLQASSWFPMGLLFALGAAGLCLLICAIINIKLGYRPMPDVNTPINRLRIRCVVIAVILVLIIGFGQFVFADFLESNRHLLSNHYRFDTLESFKEYMETPLDTNGSPLTIVDVVSDNNGDIMYIYKNQEGTVFNFQKKFITEEIYAHLEDTEPLLTYRRLNQSVSYISFGNVSDGMVSIRVLTDAQYKRASAIGNTMLIVYNVLYIAALAGVTVYYKKKKQKK